MDTRLNRPQQSVSSGANSQEVAFHIEELICELSKDYTIVIVTHNMQQAARVSQYTGFFLNGKLIEYAPTLDLFERPKKKETEDYISGRFG